MQSSKQKHSKSNTDLVIILLLVTDLNSSMGCMQLVIIVPLKHRFHIK